MWRKEFEESKEYEEFENRSQERVGEW